MKTLVLRLENQGQQSGYVATLYAPAPVSGVYGAIGTTAIEVSFAAPGTPNPVTIEEMRRRFAGAVAPDGTLGHIGDQLYAAIAQGIVGQALEAESGYRLLLDVRASGLQDVPWELMRRNNILLFADPAAPICHGSLDQLAPAAGHSWPLRMLVVVGSYEPRDGPPPPLGVVNAAAELDEIRDAVALAGADIDLEECRRRPKSEVLERIRRFRPHILHYIGHSGRTGGTKPHLQLVSEGMAPDFWFPENIVNEIRNINAEVVESERLRLVVLNACRSSYNNRADGWSIGKAFLDAGVLAVIGMNTDVPDDRAARFAGGLYRALVGHGDPLNARPLDEAVARARAAVSDPGSDELSRREWASAALHVRCAPESVIRVGAGIDAEQRRRVADEALALLQAVRVLVDRHGARWETWSGFRQDTEHPDRRVLVLEGEEGVGKTRFAYMLMQRCALCRHELRYIDMAERSADMLTLLRAIRDVSGDEYSELYERPLSNDAFKLFNQTINTVLQVPIPEDSSLDVDQGQQLGPGHRREETLRTIFEAFRTCLFAVAEQSPPLVLVIDHLNLEKQDFMLVEKELLRYCVKRLDIGVMLLLDDKHSDYQISQRPGLYRRFQVPKLPRDQWVELAMEYIRRVIVEKQLAVDKQKTWLERGRELVEQYIATDDWLPGDLEWVVSGLERRYR